jgi:hypothetical protein
MSWDLVHNCLPQSPISDSVRLKRRKYSNFLLVQFPKQIDFHSLGCRWNDFVLVHLEGLECLEVIKWNGDIRVGSP